MRVFFLSLILLSNIFGGAPASAGQGIEFDDAPGALLTIKLREWLLQRNQPLDNLAYALVHLNADAAPELLVRIPTLDDECSKLRGCRYLLFAQGRQDLVMLGEFQATELYMGKTAQTGHRDLRVCESPWNDFDCRRYFYDPRQGQYVFEDD